MKPSNPRQAGAARGAASLGAPIQGPSAGQKPKRRSCQSCVRLRKERALYKGELERLRKIIRAKMFAAIARIDAELGEQREIEHG